MLTYRKDIETEFIGQFRLLKKVLHSLLIAQFAIHLWMWSILYKGVNTKFHNAISLVDFCLILNNYYINFHSIELTPSCAEASEGRPVTSLRVERGTPELV